MAQASCGPSLLWPNRSWHWSCPPPPAARAFCGPREVDIDHAAPPPPAWVSSVARASCGPMEVDIVHTAPPSVGLLHGPSLLWPNGSWHWSCQTQHSDSAQGRRGRGGVWQEVCGRRGTWREGVWRGRRMAEETHAGGGGRDQCQLPWAGGVSIVVQNEVNSNFRGQHMRNAYLHLGMVFRKTTRKENIKI